MGNDFKDYFRGTFTKALNSRLRELVPGQEEGICKDIEDMCNSIIRDNKVWIKDEPSKTHLATTSLVLAAYRILSKKVTDRETILSIIQFAFLEPAKGLVPQMRSVLEKCQDDFKMAVESSKDKERNFYGETFIFECERDDGKSYLVNVRKCFYCDFFTVNGVPELVPIFCEWDNIFASVLKEGKYGFTFERPETLGHGGEMCRFYFKRL